MNLFLRSLFLLAFLYSGFDSVAQLNITPAISAQSLAQKLVGDGVTISNVSFRGDAQMLMAGHFTNIGGTNINIESGIVLTSGRSLSSGTSFGVDGDGVTAASDIFSRASNSMGVLGDDDLATALGLSGLDLEDASVLEFDFVPLGDSIRFRYIFSSEEYILPFACPATSDFNDAFAFFISGPGFPALTNIALVPGTNIPVSIFNVNNVLNGGGSPACPSNPSYYVNNRSNTFFRHDGHTTVLTALAEVQPCQVYHLKLVISDVGDDQFDSGVFLEAKSLSSNAVSMINNTQQTQTGESYLVEGCVSGSFVIRRPEASPFPLIVNLQYSGTAQNGLDVQTMPSTITIPANQIEVIVPIIPLVDNIPEGIEFVKVYSLAACASATALPIDSTVFQIRDYDTLGISINNLFLSQDSAIICRNTPIQLSATAGYNSYAWTPSAGLSDPNIRNPVALPTSQFNTYIATAQLGTCNARDSIFFEMKMLELVSTQNVNCSGATTGQIIVSGGIEWASPIQYSIDNQPYQNNGIFNNLSAGNHVVRINDGSCIDSINVVVNQAFPDLLIPDAPVTTPGNCTGGASGSITLNATGGRQPYQYSSNGLTFQTNNVLMVASGTYDVTVKDANGCTSTFPDVLVGFVNSVALATGIGPVICESKSTVLPATATANSVLWEPSASLDNPAILNPTANPTTTTKYIITATTGICSKKDSVIVFVNAAPIPNAGADVSICFGGTTNLDASGAMEYTWRPATYLASITDPKTELSPRTPIKYYLKVKDFNGCQSLTEDTVEVFVTPAVKMFAGNDTIIAVGQPLQLRGMQVGGNTVVTYTWTEPYGLNNPGLAHPIAILDKDVTYTLTGRTSINCEGNDEINIKVYKGPEIYVPTVFTPNGDMRNDILKAWAIGMKEYRYFRVYNRWGVLVYSSNDFNRGWDGKIKGNIQGTGTYIWIAEAVDYKGNVVTRKGTTTLIQ